jgi:1,4-dihydroxy-6-naphthoate synthase
MSFQSWGLLMPNESIPIRVGHSPDPDDAFMFYALAKEKIHTGRYRFTHELVDIETLNQRALRGELELTAISFHAYAFVHERYILCQCGASMGDGYGPIVVARSPMTVDDLRECPIAVPGRWTSAFLALRIFLRTEFPFVIVPFDEIPAVVSAGAYRGKLSAPACSFTKDSSHFSSRG